MLIQDPLLLSNKRNMQKATLCVWIAAGQKHQEITFEDQMSKLLNLRKLALLLSPWSGTLESCGKHYEWTGNGWMI